MTSYKNKQLFFNILKFKSIFDSFSNKLITFETKQYFCNENKNNYDVDTLNFV